MKAMKLYAKVERIYNELEELGFADGAPLEVETLVAFDQYHYHGTQALDVAIERLAIDAGTRALEVGAGIGGPARYVAQSTGCSLTALELQADLDRVGRDLTTRCGLADRITHRCGDVMTGETRGEGYDALLSLLVFLHIPNCRESLRPGGKIFIEDFTKRQEPTDAQWQGLRVKVQCPSLESAAEYRRLLEDAGFTDIAIEDMSESWTAFTGERYRAFCEARARNLKVHGPEIVEGLEEFYRVISTLYAQEVLGGLRVTATAR